MKPSRACVRPSLAALLAASTLALSASSRAEIVERIIARVNGDIVTQSEFESRQLASVQAAHIAADQVESYLRQNNARILQEAIDDLLIVQRAEVVRRARGGEDFGALARARSTAASRAAGGELGRVAKGDMNPELEKIVSALPAGAVSDPIQTAGGYRIVRVVSKEEASVTPFEEVKDEILKRLGQERMASAYEAYVEGLRKASHETTQTTAMEVAVQVPNVAAPTLTGPGLAAPPASASPLPALPSSVAVPALPAIDPSEISTTPQAQPARIVPAPPPGGPAAPAPPPTPSPSPGA